MQTQYVDKYEEELRKARIHARSVPLELAYAIGGLCFIGAEKKETGNIYYYKDQDAGTYYYDTDTARRFRKQFPPRRKSIKK